MINTDNGKTWLNWLKIKLVPARFIDFSEFETEEPTRPDYTLQISPAAPIVLHDFNGRQILYHPGIDPKDSRLERPDV